MKPQRFFRIYLIQILFDYFLIVTSKCYLITGVEDETERHNAYKRLLASEQLVVFNTMKKLFAHLHFIHTMAHANKMSAYNLAAVWAPTIMPTAVVNIF